MRSQNSKLPKYVYRQKVKGSVYYRFRRAGLVHRLPGTPGTADFHSAYAALLRDGPGDGGRYKPGSVAALIHKYRTSAEWSSLAGSTQRDYGRYLDRLDNSVGGDQARAIDPDYVAALLDTLKETRGKSNHTLSIIRTLFQWGMSPGRKLVDKDPTAGFEKLQGVESHRRWPEEQITLFLDAATAMMRLALMLGIYTGQRVSDVIRMTWDGYDGARIKIVQLKTGTELLIPVHPDLRAALDAAPRQGKTILTSKKGLRYHDRVFSRDFLEARVKVAKDHPDLKFDPDLTFHGLRHRTGSALAEAGATAPQIAAILGHKSLQSVMVYIRQAQQKLQAEQAMTLLPSAKWTAKTPVTL